MSEKERTRRSVRAKRWTTGQARRVIEKWKQSGLTATAFAEENDLSASRLFYWTKQLEREGASAERPPQFVSVPVRSSDSDTESATAIVIELGDLTLRVREGVDAQYVAQLVAALGRGASSC